VAKAYSSIKVTTETLGLLRQAKEALMASGTNALPLPLRSDLGDEVTMSALVALGAKQVLHTLKRRR
jgi:hypothetical protein